MKQPHLKYHHERGIAIVTVLAFVVLLTVAIVAFFARATAGSQLSSSSFHQANVDELARSALQIITGDLKQEIVNGSTVRIIGEQKTYVPSNSTNMAPVRNPAPPIPNLMPTLLRISTDAEILAPGADHPASSALSSAPSANGRSISPARWNKHYLLPRDPSAIKDKESNTTPISDFTAPKWVYVTDRGPEAISAPKKTVTGRYAYAIYDEGALLDANVAGYPMTPIGVLPPSAPHPTPDPYNLKRFGYGGKGAISFADLTKIGLPEKATTDLVAWRNYASAQPSGSFGESLFEEASAARYFDSVVTNTNGFLKVSSTTWKTPGSGPRTDQAFVSRQQLLELQKALGFSVDALPYLGTFSRAVTAPSWTPATPTGSTINYSSLADDSSAINRNFVNVRHAMSATITQYNDDGTLKDPLEVRAGDPLVPRRFSLAKLAWLGHDGPNTAVFATSLTAAQRAAAIKACFGLTWSPSTGGSSSNARWNYDHGDSNNIMTLEEVIQARREPDFFELLKAGILHGSLGGHPGATAPNINHGTNGPNWEGPLGKDFEAYSLREDHHLLQIGVNIIDQSDADNYPTAIYLNNMTKSAYSASENEFYNTVFGMENLPLIQAMGVISCYRPNHGATALTPIPTPDVMAVWLQPEIWNPHDSTTADLTNYPKTPTSLRLVTYGSCYLWNAGDDPFHANHSPTVAFGTDTTNPNASGIVYFKNLASSSTIPLPFYDQPISLTGHTVPARNYQDTAFGTTINANRYPVGATAALWDGNLTNREFMAVWLGDVYRDTTNANSIIWPTPNFHLTFVLEYHDGTHWRPYTAMARQGQMVTQNSPQYGSAIWGNILARPDPRTDRFSVSSGRQGTGAQSYQWKQNASILYLDPSKENVSPTPPKLERHTGLHRGWPRASAGFTHTLAAAPDNLYHFDDWLLNLPTSGFRYKDPDGVTRPGDAFRGSFSTGDGMMTYSLNNKPPIPGTGSYLSTSLPRRRPVILNRPFRSVGELGYAFRDQPFKTVDLWSSSSADGGLLDLFSVRDEPSVVAGKINPNSASEAVLKAIITGTIANDTSTQVLLSGSQATTEASVVAQAIVDEIKANGPLVNPADLVNRLGTPIYTALAAIPQNDTSTNKPLGNKTYAEASMRALSSSINLRTWNLMIDVIAQSGKFPPSAATDAGSLSSAFIVQGERRYWLHVAIDRFTGKIVDQQLEAVYE